MAHDTQATSAAVFVISRDQQLLVITHQATGMKLRAIGCKAFTRKQLPMAIIRGAEKTDRSIIAALNVLDRHARAYIRVFPGFAKFFLQFYLHGSFNRERIG